MALLTGAIQPAVLRLSPACDFRAVQPATEAVRHFLAVQGCGEDELSAVELALAEACNNAIKYVGDVGRTKPIGLEATCDANEIELRVTDHTAGFEWPEKIELPEAESESGRGLFLIQSLMDDANYFRGRGENILVMRRKRTSRPVLHNEEATREKLSESETVINGMIEELSSCYESLSAIFRHSADQSRIGDPKTFAQTLLKDLLNIIGADWYVLRLVSPGHDRLAMFVASDTTLDLPALKISGTAKTVDAVEAEAAAARREVWFDILRPLTSGDPLTKVEPRSQGLVYPFFVGDELIGTLAIGKARTQFLSGQQGVVFTAGQTNVVATFADFLAIHIANTRYHEEQVGNRLVARELEIANNIQQSLLPKQLPALPGFELAAGCRSAHQVGGDFYDVLKISEDVALLAVADVMGKGVPAAMFAAILRTMLRAAPELMNQPAALLTRVNRLLFEELSGVDMFITAQLACVDVRARKLTIANAGHCPLFLATPGAPVKMFSPDGIPLGILVDTVFAEETIALPADSRVLIYTDGLTEALNATGERYGQDRLMNWWADVAARGLDAVQLKAELNETLEKFQSNMVLSDDQTFLIMTG
ncbi:MAG TPA: SpoIIE family protein phosphatase [Verrucomicrobiae bacterium]|jgi:serine phosphatase RsbU (regulator of sigma subunit)/anti-sigma regulatory factor (Ser/Thr protein kinase)|nr:SpoIIE family protein phosphatase [Verrucomicrobiae bacterium]